jgi:hypothetical protein
MKQRKPRVYKLLDGSVARVYTTAHNTFELQKWPNGSQIETIFDAQNRRIDQTIRSEGEEVYSQQENEACLKNEIWISRDVPYESGRQAMMGPKRRPIFPKIADRM